ncbi:hypothetical protein CY35_12G114400 [Sphagnum magellanicum]|nr:hypothetical protein CY35_12G114400 [Sphagnum magellanicum]
MIVPTNFSLVCFRLRTPAGSKDNSRTLNSKLVEALNRKCDILVTHMELSGIYTLRFAVGGTHVELHHVQAAWNLIQVEGMNLQHGARNNFPFLGILYPKNSCFWGCIMT